MNRKTIEEFEKLGFVLPDRYTQFLLDCNNNPKKVCIDYLRIALYTFELFVEMQTSFEIKEYCPEYVAIGCGSGGEVLLMEQKRDANTLIITEAGNLLSEYINRNYCKFYDDFFSNWVERGCPASDVIA